MKRKVYLRNKAGEFCTLGDFCAEQPSAKMPPPPESPRNGHLNLEKAIKGEMKIKRLLEIVKAFDLPCKQGSCCHQPEIRIRFDGTVSYSAPLKMESILGLTRKFILLEDMPKWCNYIVQEHKKASKNWQATYYEIEEE